MYPGTWTYIDNMVGRGDSVFIMLNHNNGIAQISESHQGLEESFIITLVQANRGLVKDIHHTHKASTNLAGQPDTLGFTAG